MDNFLDFELMLARTLGFVRRDMSDVHICLSYDRGMLSDWNSSFRSFDELRQRLSDSRPTKAGQRCSRRHWCMSWLRRTALRPGITPHPPLSPRGKGEAGPSSGGGGRKRRYFFAAAGMRRILIGGTKKAEI